MVFSYWEYFMYNLMLPVFGLAFVAVPVYQLLKRVAEQARTGERRVFWDGKAILFFVVMIAVGIFLGKSLFFDGGIHLVYEHPKAAVTVEGELEDIKKYSALKGVRYAAYGETSCGYAYTIDGVTVSGMAKGTLEAGDQVRCTYLPKSGFVLSIEELNP